MIIPYKNKITIDYEISYFGFDFDRKSTKQFWIVSSPERGDTVKMERFQIKRNVPNLKWTLLIRFFCNLPKKALKDDINACFAYRSLYWKDVVTLLSNIQVSIFSRPTKLWPRSLWSSLWNSTFINLVFWPFPSLTKGIPGVEQRNFLREKFAFFWKTSSQSQKFKRGVLKIFFLEKYPLLLQHEWFFLFSIFSWGLFCAP